VANRTHTTIWDRAIEEIVAKAVAEAIRPLQADIEELKKRVDGHRPGLPLTRKEVMKELAIHSTTMSKYIGAGVIHPADTTLNGEKHRFTRAELNRVKALPSGQIRTMLAMFEAKKKREARKHSGPAPV